MKKIVLAVAAVAAATLAAQASAQAQNAPVYRYCLMDNSSRDTAGMVLCRFDTLAQCLASRNSFADSCYINPQYSQRR